jgi:hypothetical protein
MTPLPPAPSDRTHLLRILAWLGLALVLAGLALVVDGCLARPAPVFRAPVISRPLPVPTGHRRRIPVLIKPGQRLP